MTDAGGVPTTQSIRHTWRRPIPTILEMEPQRGEPRRDLTKMLTISIAVVVAVLPATLVFG